MNADRVAIGIIRDQTLQIIIWTWNGVRRTGIHNLHASRVRWALNYGRVDKRRTETKWIYSTEIWAKRKLRKWKGKLICVKAKRVDNDQKYLCFKSQEYAVIVCNQRVHGLATTCSSGLILRLSRYIWASLLAPYSSTEFKNRDK